MMSGTRSVLGPGSPSQWLQGLTRTTIRSFVVSTSSAACQLQRTSWCPAQPRISSSASASPSGVRA
ncbi:unnamed protein product [Symbiodinium pilosum]|uniref:Uncharacterized protein n=1 Tax=Symbiodinium pilosum TaxID=2952 RepID=A0A812WYB5_SYMPI|nr:unnamed protein product [Symbiodinium pilosum]